MIIRRERLAAFDAAAMAGFIGEIAAYLRSNHSAVEIRLPSGTQSVGTLPIDQLRELIENAIRRARRHNLEFASNQKAFVVLMFLVAPNFDRFPLIESMLRVHEGIADFRFHRVWEDVSESDWQDAKRNYDAVAWR